MTAPLPLFDVVAQLRRRWVIVAAGVLVGLVVGVAAGSPSPSGLQLGLGAAVGAVVGIVAGLVVVHLQPRVTTVADVRRVTGLPVVGQLPARSVGADWDVLDERPASRRLRTSFRETVMNTRGLAGGRLPQRLLLARTDSAADTFGVDAGIARALAEGGSATALLDSDLESRILADPGTASDSRLDESARHGAFGYVQLAVPARVAGARPQDRLAEVDTHLAQLGDRYDVTVVQAAGESLPLAVRDVAPVADGVLVVVRSNRTTVEALLALYGELLSLGVQPLGVLLTGVATRHRVLLRSTWGVTDFREAPRPPATGDVGPAEAVAAPFSAEAPASVPAAADVVVADHVDADDFDDLDDEVPASRTAGFSIADLVARAAQTDAAAARSRDGEA